MASTSEPVAFVVYGGYHDLTNNIDSFNDYRDSGVGYIVFVPE